jgi:NADPH:quinone reductase-like Zn-dependent oxidoreductase
MSLLTAWQFLIETGHDATNPFQPFAHKAVPLQGRTVLVNGAGGGVGHLAVQIARWKGAKVIAVASSRHETLLRELGQMNLSITPKQPPRTTSEMLIWFLMRWVGQIWIVFCVA